MLATAALQTETIDPVTFEILSHRLHQVTKDLEQLDTRFDELCEQSYGQGSGYRQAGKDVISFRVRATGQLRRPRSPSTHWGPGTRTPHSRPERRIYFQEHGD